MRDIAVVPFCPVTSSVFIFFYVSTVILTTEWVITVYQRTRLVNRVVMDVGKVQDVVRFSTSLLNKKIKSFLAFFEENLRLGTYRSTFKGFSFMDVNFPSRGIPGFTIRALKN